MGLISFAAFLVLGRLQAAPDVTRISIRPSQTDPAINSFDYDHVAYIDEKAPKRGQLLLFIPGTGGKSGLGASKFCDAAAHLGFHAIMLMYPDSISATSVRKDSDPEAMFKFRVEIIEGRDLSPDIKVDRANSIENRLIKALRWLQQKRPNDGWGQYLNSDGDLAWDKIVPSGLSQGAGHAVVLGYLHRVPRVVAFGGPKDWDTKTRRPASWYSKSPKTPIGAFFTFNHQQDRQGCTFAEQLQNCRSMGLEALAKPADVDTERAPFHRSRILFTNYPGTTLDSGKAHTSVVSTRTTPDGPNGKPLFLPVWEYMLTAPTD